MTRRIQSITEAHRKMSFALNRDNTPAPVSAKVTTHDLIVHLADGRIIVTPLSWYPPLMAASRDKRRQLLLGPTGIHWPDLDEDLSVAAMLAGVIPTYQW